MIWIHMQLCYKLQPLHGSSSRVFSPWLPFDISIHLSYISSPITFLTISHVLFSFLKIKPFEKYWEARGHAGLISPLNAPHSLGLLPLLFKFPIWKWSCAQYNVLECINYSLCNKSSLIRSGSRHRWCGGLRGKWVKLMTSHLTLEWPEAYFNLVSF